MKKVLVINAHVAEVNQSRTLKTLEAFLSTYKEVNPNDEITQVNLYDGQFPELNKDLFAAWAKLGAGESFDTLTEEQKFLVSGFANSTEQFLAADKVIIANPLWNLSIPARLKNWIDTINVGGKTFKYTENGPVGLATGKKVLHIQSAGGDYQGQDSGSKFIKSVLNFVGVEDFTKIAVDALDQYPAQKEEMLASILNDAAQLARTF